MAEKMGADVTREDRIHLAREIMNATNGMQEPGKFTCGVSRQSGSIFTVAVQSGEKVPPDTYKYHYQTIPHDTVAEETKRRIETGLPPTGPGAKCVPQSP